MLALSTAKSNGGRSHVLHITEVCFAQCMLNYEPHLATDGTHKFVERNGTALVLVENGEKLFTILVIWVGCC